jgi:hypothetical protein
VEYQTHGTLDIKRDIRTARADGMTAAKDDWPQSTLWYSVTDSVHCSRASVLPRIGLARDPARVLNSPIPHDHEQASYSD